MNQSVSSRSYRVLRYRDFRLLWSAEALSQAGSQIQRVAIAWQVYELTHDAFKLGLLGLFRFIPILFFGLVGGVIADRGDRRHTLIWTQTALLALALVLAAMSSTGHITVWVIYLVTMVAAVFEGISNPTRQALMPLLVPRAELPAASTMGVLVSHVSQVVGPAAGGIIIATIGVTGAYVIDALSFLAVIVAVLLMHQRPPAIAVTMSGYQAALEGLRFLKNTPTLFGVMLADFLATLFGACTALMPIFADEVLGVGPRGLGFLLAAPAAGAVTMAIVMSVTHLPDKAGLWVLGSIVAYGCFLVGFGLSTTLWVSMLFLAFSGAADSISMALRHAARTLLTPDDLRGRVASVHRAMGMGGPQLGEFQKGITASFIGAGPAVALGGICTVGVAAVIAWIFPTVTRYRLSVSEANPPVEVQRPVSSVQ
ncbi:MAG: MFS transporter [Thermomicrobiales bacterium]|nr:MAG: MFS transporter [Thermomicrobiales bacterium]